MNKFLYYFLCLFVVVASFLFFPLSAISSAYTLDEFIEFSNIVKDLDDATAQQKASANWLINNQTTIKNYYGTKANTLNSWKIDYSASSGWGWAYRITGYQDGNFNGWNNSGSLDFITGQSDRYFVGQAQNINWQPNKNLGGVYSFQYCLLNETMAKNVDFTGKIGNQYYNVNPLELIHGFSEDLDFNGDTIQAVLTSYSNSYTIFEKLIGYDGYTNISCVLNDGYSNIVCEFHDLDSYGTIGVNTRSISFNKLYNLVVTVEIDDTYEITEGVVFLPYGTVISSGSIVSIPSGDMSFSVQDSTNDILNFLGSSEGIDQLYDQYFSSGEIWNTLQYQPIINSYSDVIYNTLNNFASVLTTQNDNAYFDFNIHGYTTRLYASDFATPADHPLIIFIRYSMIFGTVWLIYLEFKHIIDMVNSMRLNEVLEYSEPDLNFYDM